MDYGHHDAVSSCRPRSNLASAWREDYGRALDDQTYMPPLRIRKLKVVVHLSFHFQWGEGVTLAHGSLPMEFEVARERYGLFLNSSDNVYVQRSDVQSYRYCYYSLDAATLTIL